MSVGSIPNRFRHHRLPGLFRIADTAIYVSTPNLPDYGWRQLYALQPADGQIGARELDFHISRPTSSACRSWAHDEYFSTKRFWSFLLAAWSSGKPQDSSSDHRRPLLWQVLMAACCYHGGKYTSCLYSTYSSFSSSSHLLLHFLHADAGASLFPLPIQDPQDPPSHRGATLRKNLHTLQRPARLTIAKQRTTNNLSKL